LLSPKGKHFLMVKNIKNKAHAYNPSYLGGWDWEDHGLRPLGKKVSETSSQTEAGHSGTPVIAATWEE
jgi:hypothetical protein